MLPASELPPIASSCVYSSTFRLFSPAVGVGATTLGPNLGGDLGSRWIYAVDDRAVVPDGSRHAPSTCRRGCAPLLVQEQTVLVRRRGF